jgi:cytochrome c-type biogenesis protein CcmE
MKPKYLLGGALLIAAVGVVIVQGLAGSAQYFLTVDQLREKAAVIQGQNVRISGAVIGESIRFDAQTVQLEFDIVDTVQQIGTQPPLHIRHVGPRPELLENHAQAIVEGRLQPDGSFQADTLLLQCPTRYEEQFPEQVN